MIYLLIAIICGVLLIVMAAMGGFGDSDIDIGGDADVGFDLDHDIDLGHDIDVGHGDFGGSGISPLSVPILLIFGTMFGCTGGILEAVSYDPMLTPIIAIAVSAIVTVITFVVMVRVFVNTQGSTAVGLNDLVGQEGLVTIRITESEPGQIVVATDARGRVTAPAISKSDIPTNSQIRVIGVVGDSVMVEKI